MKIYEMELREYSKDGPTTWVIKKEKEIEVTGICPTFKEAMEEAYKRLQEVKE